MQPLCRRQYMTEKVQALTHVKIAMGISRQIPGIYRSAWNRSKHLKLDQPGRLCAGACISATVSGAVQVSAASTGGQADTRIPAFRSTGNRRHTTCRELDRESGSCSVTTHVDSDHKTACGHLPPFAAAPGQLSGRLARTFRYDALATGTDTPSVHLLRYGHLTATRHVDTQRDRTFVPVASIGQPGMAARCGAAPALQVPADAATGSMSIHELAKTCRIDLEYIAPVPYVPGRKTLCVREWLYACTHAGNAQGHDNLPQALTNHIRRCLGRGASCCRQKEHQNQICRLQ